MILCFFLQTFDCLRTAELLVGASGQIRKRRLGRPFRKRHFLWVDQLGNCAPCAWWQPRGAGFGKQTALQEGNLPFAPGYTGRPAAWIWVSDPNGPLWRIFLCKVPNALWIGTRIRSALKETWVLESEPSHKHSSHDITAKPSPKRVTDYVS